MVALERFTMALAIDVNGSTRQVRFFAGKNTAESNLCSSDSPQFASTISHPVRGDAVHIVQVDQH